MYGEINQRLLFASRKSFSISVFNSNAFKNFIIKSILKVNSLVLMLLSKPLAVIPVYISGSAELTAPIHRIVS